MCFYHCNVYSCERNLLIGKMCVIAMAMCVTEKKLRIGICVMWSMVLCTVFGGLGDGPWLCVQFLVDWEMCVIVIVL